MPTRTLAGTAAGSAEVNASSSWPAVSSTPLITSITRAPYRSTSRPAGMSAMT